MDRLSPADRANVSHLSQMASRERLRDVLDVWKDLFGICEGFRPRMKRRPLRGEGVCFCVRNPYAPA